jgi:hypothetical protein
MPQQQYQRQGLATSITTSTALPYYNIEQDHHESIVIPLSVLHIAEQNGDGTTEQSLIDEDDYDDSTIVELATVDKFDQIQETVDQPIRTSLLQPRLQYQPPPPQQQRRY